MKEDIMQHSRFIIERYDQYYNNINNKGQFYLGINTLMIGATVSILPKITKYCSQNFGFHLLIITFAISCFFSVLITLKAIHPYLKKSNTNRVSSLIFFKSISEYSCSEFHEKFMAQSTPEIKSDLVYQIHALAHGLNIKFKYLRYASCFLTIEFVLGFIIIILISKNPSI